MLPEKKNAFKEKKEKTVEALKAKLPPSISKKAAETPETPREYPHQTHPALVRGIAIDEQLINYRIDRIGIGITGTLMAVFIAWGIFSTQSLQRVSDLLLAWVVANLGWLFNILACIVLLFIVFIGASRYGHIPLGHDGEKPKYSYPSWIAMMFSAGIGSDLLFFGTFEPMTYLQSPPPFSSAKPGTYQAANDAMSQTMLHWGLNAWAIYALVGGAVAYSIYRRGREPLMSRVFVGLLGHKIAEGGLGRAIDMLAIATTLFGTAASLGIGVLQITQGVEIISGLSDLGNKTFIAIMTVLTICFIVSAVSGVSRGIKYLSNINMIVAFGLMIFIFIAGPTVFLLDLMPSAVSNYLGNIFHMLTQSPSWGPESSEFVSAWTVFYWAWWISWSPFVGIFIARISRGRTIRQFVGGVLLVPTLVCLFSFSIYGGTSMWMRLHGSTIGNEQAAEKMLFDLFQSLPAFKVTSVLVMFCLATFFITSADSASVVMGSLSQQGKPEPNKLVTVFWGLCLSGIAAVGLLVGGENALKGLQNLVIITSVPFAIVVAVMMAAFLVDLRRDPYTIRQNYGRWAVAQAVEEGVKHYGDNFKLVVIPTPDDQGVGADFDSKAPKVTEWYQRTDGEGNPIGYDYARETYLDQEGNPIDPLSDQVKRKK